MQMQLDSNFLAKYANATPPFGFNGLGELVYMRTYSRLKPNGENEKWFETIQRVVEGTYSLQKKHIENLSLGWNEKQAQASAQEMYDRMFNMKFLPPGRGLWAMGTDIVNKKGLAASLNNCGFVSTENMGTKDSFSKAFTFTMDMSMLGVGIGFDTKGAGNFVVQKSELESTVFVIEDTREGWVTSVGALIDSFNGGPGVTFDYTKIRPMGIPLKTFGGLSSGPQPLIDLHDKIVETLTRNLGQLITVTSIVDIMNLIGKCVVSGNVRRCLPEGTLIHTQKGLIPIEKIDPGTLVYTSEGLEETCELVYQGEQEVITVTTELGDFECTEKHKMAVVSGLGTYTWKCANELLDGDQLVFPNHVVEGEETISLKDAYDTGYNDSKNNKTISNYILCGTADIRKSYLDGLTHEYVVNSNKCLFISENSKFLKTVQCIYASLGIPTKINNTYLSKLEKSKTSSSNFYPIKFKGISRTGKVCATYDIAVPSAKEFIAAEGLLVHNTALISFGNKDSEEFMDLKDYTKNPQRMDYGWTSNNSIFADLGMDYTEVAKRICINGEPGIAWLENMKQYSRMCDPPDNKDYRVMGGNPCLEQSLESYELCCVTADTRIQTDTGCPKIGDVVGETVNVWNGINWSPVVPFMAAREKDIYRVTLSDGSHLDCTDNHKWSIKKSKNIFKEVETKDLCIGNYIETFSLDVENTGYSDSTAFELGLFAGDGYIDGDRPMISFCGQKVNLQKYTDIKGVWYKVQHPPEYKEPIQRLSLKNVLDLDLCRELNDKTKGLPDYIFELDRDSILRFVAGYIETDGCLRKNQNNHHYTISGSELKLRDLQILLRRIGINHATIRLASPKGFETNMGIRNQELYSLCIPTYECGEIPTFIKKATLIGSGKSINHAHPDGKLISNKTVQKIKSVEKLEQCQDTFCFTEPETHKGVFGNMLTHQCLVENFLNRAESLEDFQRTLKFSYLYAKTVTLAHTHCSDTNRVQLRNRRIGCSVSGVAQFLTKYNLHTLNNWLNPGYKTIQEWDTVYSDWLCIPRSIKTTSIKPSGTVSLLAGATPGMHYPESRFYIRRMRLSKISPLVQGLKDAGYFMEPAVGSERDTLVVEIPIDVGEGIRTVSQVSMWEQVALAANMQKWWADNQVSCTVTFNPETEGSQIASALDYFQYQLKGISFLPKCNYGAFPQMPYEEITEEVYHTRCSTLGKLNLTGNQDSTGEKFCDGDSCVKH